MRKILGLDLGTNSIGWAVVNEEQIDDKSVLTGIDSAGSRIIPMDASVLGDFARGNKVSQTANRTALRGARRRLERKHLRRERLHRVLMKLDWLPVHYQESLDRYGKILKNQEPKFAWYKDSEGKYTFLFMDSYNEMLSEFRASHGELLEQGLKIPYDWTIYFLRKKALTRPVTNYELAWILLNFNQKRGYFQLRGDEEEETPNKRIEYLKSLVTAVIPDDIEESAKEKWYSIKLENGIVYRRKFDVKPDWEGKEKEFIVTTDIDKDGNPVIKDGEIKRSLRQPKDDDWALLKKKTESDIEQTHKTVGEYIYDSLLAEPSQKIRGKLVRTIERKYYRQELNDILQAQKKFNPVLTDAELYRECLDLLYSNNESYKASIRDNDFTYLFVDDIIFYQRPLKSKKSLIANCPYEEYAYKDKITKEEHKIHIKCIAKSHPLFQEFRLWQFIHNLKLYQYERYIDGKLLPEYDITGELLSDNSIYADLYEWLSQKDKINMNTVLSFPGFQISKNDHNKYRWNYPIDKQYPGNETKVNILKYLKKAGIEQNFLTKEVEQELWHILYSVSIKEELKKALMSFSIKHSLENADIFCETFVKFPPFEKNYGAYSEKAIKKLLPLMRRGKFWSESDIDFKTRSRIDKIINGEFDQKIKEKVRKKTIDLTEIADFQGLPLWFACYVVYDRYSEGIDVAIWEKPDDIDDYLKNFKQHSLRNPIVEQVVLETLRTVRDVWKQSGRIDEIHIELGREMKNPADKRRRLSEQIAKNENANMRIKALLTEFLNPEFEIDNVRPYSPSQQEILKIYEETVLNTENIETDIVEILKKFNETDIRKRPTHSEILRYKLWLDQKYRSPYTGKMIPLGKLFTDDYEIEHIIPKAKYFDDSLSNKVICESEVNKLKRDLLGYEFIKLHGGEIVTLNFGERVKVLSVGAYEQLVKENYSHNRVKQRKLLMDDIPDEFITRQLNDSRYISKMVKSILSNLVREEGEDDAISKNVITCTGQITDRLKKDWGVNNVWNEIVLPRFERLETISGQSLTAYNTNGIKIPSMPLFLDKGFSVKRIDHRHHAMDAIVIACANRNIVSYLNNESACKDAEIKRYDLRNMLCRKGKIDENGHSQYLVKQPWDSFIPDVRTSLDRIIVSFKSNVRILTKTTNHYFKYKDGKKKQDKQIKGDSRAIRKPLHKYTVFGEVNLRNKNPVPILKAISNPEKIVDKVLKNKIITMLSDGQDAKAIIAGFKRQNYKFMGKDISKVEMYIFSKDTNDRYFASRTGLEYLAKITKDKIDSAIENITDTGIRMILRRHLSEYNGDPAMAFSPNGLDTMNANIISLNNGKMHKPIYKIRKFEKAEKFCIGEFGNKSKKFVEAAKGTNLFFAIYASNGSRVFESIPLNQAVDNMKSGLSPVPECNETGDHLLFSLSPNDLVYVPTEDDIERGIVSEPIDRKRIYKMVSCTGTECHFIPVSIANPIIQTKELGSNNKSQKAWTNEMIKEICIPVKVDRLGNLVDFNARIL